MSTRSITSEKSSLVSRTLVSRTLGLLDMAKDGRSSRSSGYILFVMPALLLSIGAVLLPALFTAVSSFTEWDGISRPEWTGLENYRVLLSDETFWKAIFNNLRWTAIFLTIPMALALVTASVLLKKRNRAVFQIIFLIPYILSPIANAQIWKFIIFDPISGVNSYINHHLFPLVNPLGDPGQALYAVAAVDIWHFWGYLAVIFLASMRQIPAEQLEAAYLEGASSWQLFRYVTLPNIIPTIAMMFVFVTIFSFLTFDYVYLLTRGGPGHSTELLATMSYRAAFHTFEVGKAAAIALFMTLFGLLASIAYIWISRETLK
jgi:raffinose/stachyose/melibiose transport system permease protein